MRHLIHLLWLVGCAGPAFEQASDAGSGLAGSPSVAGAHAAGGSVLLSGAAGDVASGVAGGNEAGNGGAPGAAGAGVDVLAGAAGDGPTRTRPCSAKDWAARAFASRDASTSPAAALDGDQITRWASGAAREPGQWFELLPPGESELVGLELEEAIPGDLPGCPVLVEVDGKPAAAACEVPYPGALVLRFEALRASVVRVTLTAAAPNWWGVSEARGLCLDGAP